MTQHIKSSLGSIPSPREMMREKRPYLFSDSDVDRSVTLPKTNFEYHLETLTARKQEYEFEDFCRKIAEKELCPNLTIQTGPTGGGDGKTDAETYPVATEIAERWWIGTPSAGSERWAFAFSAKKDWKPKLESDIKKIAETSRAYDVVYFITNQFAADRDKAKLQDDLSKQYSFRVQILDRSWIVEKVYSNGHLAMAIDTLAIEGAQSEIIQKFGPNDAARLAELAELDKQITDASRYVDTRFQLASDCYRSAILARGLERPRSEVEARFEQAMRIADELGETLQAMRIRYNYAWTQFWWFEDLKKFLSLYDDVEERIKETTHSSDAKHLHTLWSLATSCIRNGRLKSTDIDIEQKRKNLVAILDPLAANTARPNNALEAKTYLTLMRLHESMSNRTQDGLDDCWKSLAEILEASKPLGSYPVELLESVLGELGAVIDSPEFDDVYTKLTEVISQRRSEGAAGEAHVKRAFQKLELENPYEAIRWFGRAEELLLKREYRDELTQALLGSSGAYSVVGLRWAARNRALAALDHTMQEFRESGEVEWAAWIAAKQLVWSELRLGRAPQALAAMILAKMLLSASAPAGELMEQAEEDLTLIEIAFGLLLLNLHPNQLDAIAKLHDSFEEYGLVIPGMATLFSLGQRQALRDEGYCPSEQTDQDIEDFLAGWISVPGADQMPDHTILLDQATVEFRSVVLGCSILLTSNADPISVGIAESLLGGLESFMATSDERDVMPHRETLRIVMRSGGDEIAVPEHRIVEETGASFVEVIYSLGFRQDSAEKIEKYRDWLQVVLIEIICHFAIVRDVESWLTKIAADERGFSRALVFSDMLTANSNVFGDKPPIHIADHLKADAREFAPLRTTPLIVRQVAKREVEGDPKFGTGDPSEPFTKPEDMKHSDRTVLSPIQMDLWNKAGWHGTAFMVHPQLPGPLLALHFRDADAARRIFEDWRERWGREGSDENVRISIITGVDQKEPFAYSMQVAPVFRTDLVQSGKTFLSLSRYMRLNAATPDNLNNFLVAYQKAGEFGLVPAITPAGRGFPEPMYDLIQPRRKLEVRPAWMIEENDPDLSVMQDGDDPFIPDGQIDPPVWRAMAQLKKMRKSVP
ncbi:hypothetical protein Q4610_04815 [Sphingobium sp. HBC34]|uniref:Tetratricopeptide repeat protein n=1 Tax=Sphingobium cyanobacteriorum TaxID=3063954 RepID=A0ABT8ZIJ4_9SPHN|nr:hypothetical protein [Sphingobium sp. HBC34]MDO7834360.1 hypothetical protein [Sphingobium sp. HBC34]